MLGNGPDAEQVLFVLRDVLLEHMRIKPTTLPEHQVADAVYIGERSGCLIYGEHIITGADRAGGLLLRMADGNEYRLTLESLSEQEDLIPFPDAS